MGGCLPCLGGDSSDYDAPTPVSMPSSTFLHNLEKEERESVSFTSRKFSSSSQANAFSNANTAIGLSNFNLGYSSLGVGL